MKKKISTLAAAAAIPAMLATPVSASTWELDQAHTNVKFKVKHLAVANVWGQFNEYSGTVKFDSENPTASSVTVTIDVASIDTDNEKRDGHLRSADFFEVDSYPTITFVSTKVLPQADGLKVVGNLTIKDVTKEVILDVEGPSGPIDFMGTTKMAATASTKINRTDFNLTWNRALETGGVLVSEEVEIILDVELNEVPQG